MFEALALEKLKLLKRAASGELVDGMGFHKQFGICWHLFAYTKPDELGIDYLNDAFENMGLSRSYPVESQILSDTFTPEQLNFNQGFMFDADTVGGKLRLQLLDDLIKHFTLLVEVEQAEKDLQ